jgi:hypothetical protein
MHRGRLPACCCRHRWVDGLQRPSGRNASHAKTPSPITSPTDLRSRTEISPGTRAHHTQPLHRAHSPPTTAGAHPPQQQQAHLDARAPAQISSSPLSARPPTPAGAGPHAKQLRAAPARRPDARANKKTYRKCVLLQERRSLAPIVEPCERDSPVGTHLRKSRRSFGVAMVANHVLLGLVVVRHPSCCLRSSSRWVRRPYVCDR